MPGQVNKSAIKVAKGIKETVNQDGAVLLDMEQGLCFSMNPVGTRIWEMIKDGRSVDEIADPLEEKFRLPRTQLLTDVSDFVNQLENMHLVGHKHTPEHTRALLSPFPAPPPSIPYLPPRAS